MGCSSVLHSTHFGVRGRDAGAADGSLGFRLGRFRRESNVDCRLFLKACVGVDLVDMSRRGIAGVWQECEDVAILQIF